MKVQDWRLAFFWVQFVTIFTLRKLRPLLIFPRLCLRTLSELIPTPDEYRSVVWYLFFKLVIFCDVLFFIRLFCCLHYEKWKLICWQLVLFECVNVTLNENKWSVYEYTLCIKCASVHFMKELILGSKIIVAKDSTVIITRIQLLHCIGIFKTC